jgi:hypothetical protein
MDLHPMEDILHLEHTVEFCSPHSLTLLSSNSWKIQCSTHVNAWTLQRERNHLQNSNFSVHCKRSDVSSLQQRDKKRLTSSVAERNTHKSVCWCQTASPSGFTLTWWGDLLHQRMGSKKFTTLRPAHPDLNTPTF